MKTSQKIAYVVMIVLFPITAIALGTVALIKYPSQCKEYNADQANSLEAGKPTQETTNKTETTEVSE